jgi:hypothetical protein
MESQLTLMATTASLGTPFASASFLFAASAIAFTSLAVRIDLRGALAMKNQLLAFAALAALLPFAEIAAGDAVYHGGWHTTNRKLDGMMTCIVTDLGDEQWRGRFYGVWQGVSFDYPVTFSGPPSSLRGAATIDGASYTWTGELTNEAPRSFKGTFGGSRYTGYFDLKETSQVAAKPKPSPK